MRIEFKESGGIAYLPALAKPVAIDADRLDAGEIAELKRLVEAARFFDLPASIGAPKRGAADYQTQLLTIEDDGRRNAVRILVPPEDAALRDLLAMVTKLVARARASASGTGGRPRQ